jgi:putative ABC transport system permease protein
MLSPRWRKLWRDLWLERTRGALMVTAIAVSLMGIGTVLGAYAILSREMSRNYLGTHPASAALELSPGVDAALLEQVRRRPDITEADAGEIVVARAKVGEDWIPMMLFVVDDFHALRLNTFTPQSGAWPPPEGTMLIERSAVQVLQAREDDTVLIKPPASGAHTVRVSGLVHDPGLAPAWQERTGYGYITRGTLQLLGGPALLGELRVLTAHPSSREAIESSVNDLARWLKARGLEVQQARVPPPGRHPHQSQMTGILFLLLAFGVLALLLSGVLVATTMAAILARHVREIGVMKTLGARTCQLAVLYAAFVTLSSALAVVFALPAGAAGARSLASTSAAMLNLNLASRAIPEWVFFVQALAGLVVPLLVAALPILRGSRVTVREAIDQHGAPQTAARGGRAVASWMPRVLSLALRNAFRRRARLLLMLCLLAAGGATFMASVNVSLGWERIVDRVYENRHYDLEIRLNAPATVLAGLRQLPGIRTVEAWGYGRAAVYRPGQTNIVSTYPDGSHGSLALVGPPVSTRLVDLPLLAGRWLEPGDTDAIVLNHLALGQLPGTGVGDFVTLSVGERPTTWRVVGVVEEVGAPGVAYVTGEAFARALGTGEQVRLLRIAISAESPEARAELIRAIERWLEAERVSVEAVVPLALLRTAMGDHVAVLIRMLLAMAGLLATVGALSLASTMGTAVLERTREIGVLKAIGATPRQVAQLVVQEAVFVAALSWLVATALALPLTALIGRTVGLLAFRVPLPLVISPGAVAAWLGLALVVAGIATLLPARTAARLTVCDALGHV